MGHGAAGGNAIELVGDGAGSAAAARNIGSTSAIDGGGGALRAAGTELHHGVALGGADDAVGLGGDQALMVHGQKRERFKQLRLDRGRAHDDHRLFREDGRALGHGVNVAAEVEVCKIVEEFLAEDTSPAQVVDVLPVEVQILDIVDQLVEAGGNGVPASVRHRAEINVEIGNAILEPCFQVTIAHSQLVEVAEHGHIELLIGFHSHLIVSRRGLCRAL